MKSDFHFHFYSRIFILLILAVSLVLIQRSVRSNAEISSFPYEVVGWAWNNSARWVSLNCYNDFVTPGQYTSTCATVDYKLEIAQDGTITGCVWAGNNLSGGSSPLGWICFDDPFSALRTTPSDFGVATSTAYVNAIDPATFASIYSYEDWRCVGAGARTGMRCAPGSTFCSVLPYNGTCEFNDNQTWKLGFPIQKGASLDDDAPNSYACGAGSSNYGFPCNSSADCIGGICEARSGSRPIEGCFNCYETYDYRCSITGAYCTPTGGCLPTGTPPQAQECIKSNIYYNCDNCLDYFYYPGRCENTDSTDGIPDGTVSATLGCSDFTVGQDDCCKSNDDCSTGETCQPLKSCIIPTGSQVEEYECTDATPDPTDHDSTCDYVPSNPCTQREVGSYRKTLGGYNCSSCDIESYDNRCYLNADQKNLNSCASCRTVWYYPGVMIDNRHYGWDANDQGGVIDSTDLTPSNPPNVSDDVAYMCGWAWNGWDITSDGIADNGLFWFQFSPRVVTSTRPFLSVESGNIYSQKGVIADYLPPFGYYNSSYLIESGGSITNFITSSTLSGLYQGELPYQPIINYLSSVGGKYSNALGSIDYTGLITDVSDPVLKINKFGAVISENPGNTAWQNTAIGVDQVYYYSGSLSINTPTAVDTHEILSGTGTQVASKTVVVNGDLTIGDNIVYEAGSNYSNFKQIPSIVWIVRGDVTIDADVSDVAGTFIILGKTGIANCSGATPTPGCGQFISCVDTGVGNVTDTCRTHPLVVKGNVMAKYFDLTRTYVDNSSPVPSEQFINDGRLRVNPPGGFSDFSSVIPRFTDY